MWNNEDEKYYISIVDMLGVLSESKNPRHYWNDLKKKLKDEGSELSEKIGQLKLKSSDGKYYNTDVCDIEGINKLTNTLVFIFY